MPYSISGQRRRFDERLKNVKKKLRVADKRSVIPDLRDYSIAAAIFLSHAEFENYFVDVLDGVAKVYSTNALTSEKLPAKLRAHLACEKLGLESIAVKIASKIGEQELFTAVEKWFVSPETGLLVAGSLVTEIRGSNIYGDFTYPSVKNIDRVLRRLGVGDPRGSLNRELNRDVMSLLESVGSLRTALAHNATLPGISIGDVLTRIDGLKLFARAFDRVLYNQSKRSVSDDAWLLGMV